MIPRSLTLHGLVRDAVAAFDKQGDVVRLAPFRVYCLRNPDHIKAVSALTTKPALLPNADQFMGAGIFNDLGGETWQAKRRAIVPLSGEKTIAQHLTILPSCLERMSWWGRSFDLYAELRRLVVDLTARAGFSLQLHSDDLDWLTAAVQRAEDRFVSPIPWWVPTPANFRFLADRDRVTALIRGALWRRHEPVLLDHLVEAFPAEDDAIAEAMSYLFGAHAMALTLFWGVRVAFMRPDVLAALRADEDGSYTRMFLAEVLRLWPSFWGSLRSGQIELDGVEFPAGSVFAMIRVAAQRHPDYWPDPLRFDPERHATRNECPHALLPFGLGPRMCVGRSLALAVCAEAIQWIVRAFDLFAPFGDMPLRYGFGMYPALPVIVSARARV